MDDTELERLLNRYADQLSDEKLEAATPPELQDRLRRHAERETRGSSRIVQFGVVGLLGLAACVALMVFLILPRQAALRIERFELSAAGVHRGPDAEAAKLEIDLRLSRPGYIRVIQIDARSEPWLIPFDSDAKEFVHRVERDYQAECPTFPDPNDPRGPAEARFVMLVASSEPVPTKEDLLQAIPDPIAPPDTPSAQVSARLEQLTRHLEARFRCAVNVQPVPIQ